MLMPHDGVELRHVLRQLELDSRTYFGVDGARVIPDRHEARPFSDVWHARVESALGQSTVYIKIAKVNPGGPSVEIMRLRLQKDYDTTSRLHRAMQHDQDTATVRPIACFIDELAMVTEEASGTNLLKLLEQQAARWRFDIAARLEPVFERTGRWVRRFQEVEGSNSLISYDKLREYVDIRLHRLATDVRSAFNSADRQQVLEYLERRRTEIAPTDMAEVAVHADFGPGNVIDSGGRIVVLDFAMNHRGPCYLDVARFYTQMELFKLKPQFNPSLIGELQTALLRGYQADLTVDRPLFEVLLVLHTINHFGTLVTKHAHFPASVYNGFVARRHLRWIRRTTGRTGFL